MRNAVSGRVARAIYGGVLVIVVEGGVFRFVLNQSWSDYAASLLVFGFMMAGGFLVGWRGTYERTIDSSVKYPWRFVLGGLIGAQVGMVVISLGR